MTDFVLRKDDKNIIVKCKLHLCSGKVTYTPSTANLVYLTELRMNETYVIYKLFKCIF